MTTTKNSTKMTKTSKNSNASKANKTSKKDAMTKTSTKSSSGTVQDGNTTISNELFELNESVVDAISKMEENNGYDENYFGLIPGFTGTWEVMEVTPEISKRAQSEADEKGDTAEADYINLHIRHTATNVRMVLNGVKFIKSYVYRHSAEADKQLVASKKHFKSTVSKAVQTEVKKVYKNDVFAMEPQNSVMQYIVPTVKSVLKESGKNGKIGIPRYFKIESALTVEESYYLKDGKMVSREEAEIRRPYASAYHYYGYAQLSKLIKEEQKVKRVKKSDIYNFISKNKDNGFYTDPGQFDIKEHLHAAPKTWYHTLVIEFIK